MEPGADLAAELAARAGAAGVRVTRVVRNSGKAVLAAGVLEGVPVAVKLLLTGDPFWTAKFRHEVALYRLFAQSPPPVRTPGLRYTDGARILVLDWADGEPLGGVRYPAEFGPDRHPDLEAALACASGLAAWSPPARLSEPLGYASAIRRYHALSSIEDADRDALLQLLERAGGRRRAQHGDLVPGNVVIGPDHAVTLVDWEFAGRYLPGRDLAMLYATVGCRTGYLADRVEELVAAAGITTEFAVNLALITVRELRIIGSLPDGPDRRAWLPLAHASWLAARERVRGLAAR
jgi:hypothetical protein